MVAASALEPGLPEPQLQGQTQATAQPNGTISISELSLLARPGTYNVSVTLPGYPLVSIAVVLDDEVLLVHCLRTGSCCTYVHL